jgi:hypothetical protein
LLRTEVIPIFNWYTRNRMHNPIIKISNYILWIILACRYPKCHISGSSGSLIIDIISSTTQILAIILFNILENIYLKGTFHDLLQYKILGIWMKRSMLMSVSHISLIVRFKIINFMPSFVKIWKMYLEIQKKETQICRY